MTLLNIINLTILFFIALIVLTNVYITNKTSNILSHQRIDLNDKSNMSIDFKPVMYRLYYKYKDNDEPYFHILDEIMLTYESESFNRPLYIPDNSDFNNYIKFSINGNILDMRIFISSRNIDSEYSVNLSRNFEDITLSEFIDQTSSSLYKYFTLTVENIDIITTLHDYDIGMVYGLSIKNKLLITEDEYNIIMMERMLNNG